MTYELPSLSLYFKIKKVIKKRIADGTYPLGEKIPNEHDLSKEFGVNRLTVRHALILLVQEGYLKRTQRRGTFVLKQAGEFEGLELRSFFDDLFYQVAKFKAKKIEISNQTPPEIVADLYQLNRKVDQVTVIKRVRFLGETPSAYTINYLTLDIGSKVHKTDLYQMPLLQIFRDKLKIPLGEAFQTIEASIADKDIGEVLEILPGTEVLLMQRTFFTKEGRPFDFVQTYYRSDKIRYFVRFRYDDAGDQLLLTR